MPRSCTVCEHPERGVIDEALVGGASNRLVASLYDVSEAAVPRHKGNHLPAKLVMAQAAEEVAQADELLSQVQEVTETNPVGGREKYLHLRHLERYPLRTLYPDIADQVAD